LPDGTELRRLTNNDVDEHDPVWSPDGRRIAFTRAVPMFTPPSGVRPAIYVMRADGSGVKRLTRTSDGWSPAWSPDGRRIAFVGIWHHAAALFVMNADGSGVHRVPKTALGGTEFTAVDWSKDGTRLVFTAHAGTGETQLFSIPVRGGAPRQLTDNNSYYVTAPRWAPDGRAIAFIKHTYCGRNCEVASLVSRARTGVHHGLVRRATGAGWSPDGRALAFSDNRIGIVSADGKSRRYITSPSPNVDVGLNGTSR